MSDAWFTPKRPATDAATANRQMEKYAEAIENPPFGGADKLRLFAGPVYDTRNGPLQTYCADAAGRLDIVKKSTDRAALEAALRVPDMQKSVADAIKRRLRNLGFVEMPS